MLSPSYSRKNLRRSSTGYIIPKPLLFFFIFCLVVLLPVGAKGGKVAECDFDAHIENGVLYVSSLFVPVETKDLLSGLKRGLTAEIVFQFRLYKKNRGIVSFLGDRLVGEMKEERIAKYDVFEKRFCVYSDGKLLGQAKTALDFIDIFFQLQDFKFGIVNEREIDDIYLHGKVTYIPVKLKPPINIVMFFTSLGNISTKWRKIEIER